MKLILFLFFLISFILCDVNYRYLYYKYKNLYKNYVYIEENNIKYDGMFTFDNYKDICIKPKKIYIKKKLNYEKKFGVLIHELTHYLQCIHSIKYNKLYSSITNNKPNKTIIDYINESYNISHLNEEYEAFYYQNNYLKFNNLEKFVLY